MAKESERAREKFGKAQSKLARLEEELALVMTENEKELSIARARADKRVAKVQGRIDQQAEIVAKREKRVLQLSGDLRQDAHNHEMAADAIARALNEADLTHVSVDGASTSAGSGGKRSNTSEK